MVPQWGHDNKRGQNRKRLCEMQSEAIWQAAVSHEASPSQWVIVAVAFFVDVALGPWHDVVGNRCGQALVARDRHVV